MKMQLKPQGSILHDGWERIYDLTVQGTVFSYTGAVQQYTVPAGVTSVSAVLVGGEGGRGSDADYSSYGFRGGKAGMLVTTLTVTPGETLYIYVGGKGGDGNTGSAAVGGWNGGGNEADATGARAGAGGGASDIRRGGTALANRILVAGGGGGSGGSDVDNRSASNGGDGGGTSGGYGLWHGANNAAGGTQSTGYALGVGQNGKSGGQSTNSGAGGGGYYGGYSGTVATDDDGSSGGGGGSGYDSTGIGTFSVLTTESGNGYISILTFGSPSALTISGLDGDTDEEYILESKVVNGYNGSCSYLLRPNNDSGATNYGYQYIHGVNGGTGAARNTGAGIGISDASALSQLCQSRLKLFAKSGIVRTSISEMSLQVSGTTVSAVRLEGRSWNNTADNITSLVIAASQAGGIGVGSSFQLYRKSRRS